MNIRLFLGYTKQNNNMLLFVIVSVIDSSPFRGYQQCANNLPCSHIAKQNLFSSQDKRELKIDIPKISMF